VSNGIANHYRGPPCRAEHLLRRGDLVRDLVRSVEITPASPREKRLLLRRIPQRVEKVGIGPIATTHRVPKASKPAYLASNLSQ
jgi:hypothetical protein